VKTEDRLIPLYERELKDLNFTQLVNHASSIQFACISQMKNKLDLSLHWCKSKNIEVGTVVSIVTSHSDIEPGWWCDLQPRAVENDAGHS